MQELTPELAQKILEKHGHSISSSEASSLLHFMEELAIGIVKVVLRKEME
ncbi:hypothetical protein [Echinicola rosea]|nr:hypothetical protein [Echinicola rosea]